MTTTKKDTVTVSNPRARRRLEEAPAPEPRLTPAQRKKVRAGLADGRRPSELAMELVDENRRTAELAQDKLERDLRAGAGRLVNRREQLAKQRAAFERAVALAVSSKPAAPDWYDHPGPLDRARVQAAAGLNGVALHRLMERYRKAAPVKKGGRR